tara:strand:+ start:1410 stop:2069 length:660 start_codon:yes stop_codon:yes gene_type:complete
MSRGASNTQSAGFKYLSFMGGKFVQRVPEGTPGAEPRVLKKGPNEGNTIHELLYDTLGGGIIKMETEASEYGKQLHIFLDVSTVEEPEAKIKISISLSSGAAKGLLSRLPVIDFSKDVTLKGFKIERKDKPGTYGVYLVPYQDNNKLESFYTRDEPKGLPQMVKIKVKGQEVWDDTDQLEFYENLINTTNFPGEASIAPTEPIQEEAPDLEEGGNDTVF